MIKVDLHNYEAFALDYVEGRLVGDDLSAFEMFLVNHPEIKNEIDSLTSELIGFDNNDKFSYKTDLKKEALLSEDINEDNYKSYFIAYHEGDLSDQTKEKVNEFLTQHNGKSKEFETFATLKFTPDQSASFPLKRQVKKTTPVFALYKGLRVAASIAIILGIAWYFSKTNTEEQQYTQRTKVIEEKENPEVESDQVIESTASNLFNQLKDDAIVLSKKIIQKENNPVQKENQTEKQIFAQRDELLSMSSTMIQNTTINQQIDLDLKTKPKQDHVEIAKEDDSVFKIKLPKLFKKSNKEESKDESTSIASTKFKFKKKEKNPDQKTYVDLGPFKVYKKKGVTADASNLNEGKEGL